MKPTSTFGLIERGRAGDQDALSLLFEKHRRRLAVLVHYRMGPKLLAAYEVDDVLQEIFLRASRDLPSFDYQNPGSFFRWLASIAHHVISDLGRHENRDRRRHDELLRFRSPSNPEGPEPIDSTTPSRLLARKQSLQAVMAHFDDLPADYREVIVLAKLEGLSTQEIAERMGRSRQNVALLLHRAIKRLQALKGS